MIKKDISTVIAEIFKLARKIQTSTKIQYGINVDYTGSTDGVYVSIYEDKGIDKRLTYDYAYGDASSNGWDSERSYLSMITLRDALKGILKGAEVKCYGNRAGSASMFPTGESCLNLCIRTLQQKGA